MLNSEKVQKKTKRPHFNKTNLNGDFMEGTNTTTNQTVSKKSRKRKKKSKGTVPEKSSEENLVTSDGVALNNETKQSYSENPGEELDSNKTKKKKKNKLKKKKNISQSSVLVNAELSEKDLQMSERLLVKETKNSTNINPDKAVDSKKTSKKKRKSKKKKENSQSSVHINSEFSEADLKKKGHLLVEEEKKSPGKNPEEEADSKKRSKKKRKSKKKKKKENSQSSVQINSELSEADLQNCKEGSFEKASTSKTVKPNSIKPMNINDKNKNKKMKKETTNNSTPDSSDKSKISKKSVSDADSDEYSSSGEEDMELGNSDEVDSDVDDSSDESDISSGESNRSVSSFNIDSYPSDSDEDEEDEEEKEKEKKRGIPINAVPSAELEEKEKRTIFIGNLPKTVERHELKKWFSRFGKVECVRLRSAPIADLEIPRKVSVIKKSFHDNRNNIHAYIRYKDTEGALNALQANGIKFGNHTLRVDRAKHEGGYDAKRGVFVGNVAFSIEEDSLINLFSKCGEIESVRIIRDKETGVGKGFAYVNFKCSSSVPLALKLDGEMLEKREIRVKPVKYNKKMKHGNFNPNFPGRMTNLKFKGGAYGFKKGKTGGEPGSKRNQGSYNKKGGKTTGSVNTKDMGKSEKNKGFQKNGVKKTEFQGELSKRKERKPFKRKSSFAKKREIYSKILSNKKKD